MLKDVDFPFQQQRGEIDILNARIKSDIPTNQAEQRRGEVGWRIKTIQFHFRARFKSRQARQYLS